MLGDNKYIMMKRRENFQQIDSELADLNKLLKHFYAETLQYTELKLTDTDDKRKWPL